MDADFLAALRAETEKAGIVLIFDEVITGFRVSPGGVQGATGVVPDLTSLAKILAGGFPGGAVAGRKEIMDQLDFAATARSNAEKVYHPGTFNANPLSAAAGTAALRVIAGSDACARATATTEELRAALNRELVRAGVPWAVYGESSAFHIFMGPGVADPERFDPAAMPSASLKARPAETVRLLRLAMLVNGVDLAGWPGGLVSATHGATEVSGTASAFAESLRMLQADGVV